MATTTSSALEASRPLHTCLNCNQTAPPTFIDVFAGCGGLSLGLMRAGWHGLFAIERDPFAFETLSTNLLGSDARYSYSWPAWLPETSHCVLEVLDKYKEELRQLSGEVDLLVGGPPCQGYSSAGRREANDPRNQLFQSYIELVTLINPKVVLLENVRGIAVDFKDDDVPTGKINYAEKLIAELSKTYNVTSRMLDLSTFGVPQNRSRFFLVGVRKDMPIPDDEPSDPFEAIEADRPGFLRRKGISSPLCAKAAISDLEVRRNGTVPSRETVGFNAIAYKAPITPYQSLMRDGAKVPPDNTRLANHRPHIVARFREIITNCHAEGRLNTSLSRETREGYGLKKQAIRVLDPDNPSPTITSMPDDLIHYSEPRALTVRENARLQSFPDWFSFRGKYTTGGDRRKVQVPRFTQVANAVPPLAAEAIGLTLKRYVCNRLAMAA